MRKHVIVQRKKYFTVNLPAARKSFFYRIFLVFSKTNMSQNYLFDFIIKLNSLIIYGHNVSHQPIFRISDI